MFSVEDSLSKGDALRRIQREILLDPENTLCERAWWLFYGWTVKCMRTQYQGLSCGKGTHYVEWSKDKYIYREDLLGELKGQE